MKRIIKYIKVLVIEDDRNCIMLLQECLCGIDNVVVEKLFAPDAKKGMEKFNKEKPDLVFLDINLPDGNGLNLIRPMLETNPEVKIVMATGSANSCDVKTARNNGAAGYILKPYTKIKIIDAMKNLVFQSEKPVPKQAEKENKDLTNTIEPNITGEK